MVRRRGATEGPFAGTGGGAGAASACDGLIPRFGAPVIVTRDTGTHAQCDAATTSRSGQVALGTSSISGLAFDLYGAGGVPQNAFLAWISNASRHPLLDPWFHSTSAGWQGLVHEPGMVPPQAFRSWDAAGTTIRDTDPTNEMVSSAPTVDGGSVVLAAGFNLYTRNGTTPPGGPLRIEWVDAVGVVTRSAVIDDGPDLVLQAWGTKHVFVLDTDPSPWRARWYDEAGALLAAGEVTATAQGDGPHLKLLVDGRVALSDGASWVAVFADGAGAPAAPPDWLRARPGTRLATIRDGRGYAVLPPRDAGSTRLEVLTAAGESCGAFDTPAPAPPNGQRWSPSGLFVGQDGTLIELDGAFGGDLDPSIHCVYRWWPALLK